MGWISKLFGKKETVTEGLAENDIRVAPLDNPLDYREDGSIRPGDPAYDMMMESLMSGKAFVANQKEDGTWEKKELD